MKKYVKSSFEDYVVTDTTDWAKEEIQGFLELLNESLDELGNDPENMNKYIFRCRNALKEMSNIIDEVVNDLEEMQGD